MSPSSQNEMPNHRPIRGAMARAAPTPVIASSTRARPQPQPQQPQGHPQPDVDISASSKDTRSGGPRLSLGHSPRHGWPAKRIVLPDRRRPAEASTHRSVAAEPNGLPYSLPPGGESCCQNSDTKPRGSTVKTWRSITGWPFRHCQAKTPS